MSPRALEMSLPKPTPTAPAAGSSCHRLGSRVDVPARPCSNLAAPELPLQGCLAAPWAHHCCAELGTCSATAGRTLGCKAEPSPHPALAMRCTRTTYASLCLLLLSSHLLFVISQVRWVPWNRAVLSRASDQHLAQESPVTRRGLLAWQLHPINDR